MSKAWKDAEREVAAYFGVKRRVRIDYGESIGDTTPHEDYSIEIKYGKCIPGYLRVTGPTIIRVVGKLFRLWPSTDSGKDTGTRGHEFVELKSATFLVKAMDQARGYNPTKKPLVCVKARGMRGFVICEEIVNVSE